MKLLGVILLLWAGTLGGCAAAGSLDRKVKQIRIIRQLVTAMTAALRNTLPLVADLLRELAGRPEFRSLGFLQEAAAQAESFPECWENALRHDLSLAPETRAVLETVGRTLGSTALEGQLPALALCLERLGALQEDAAQTAQSRGRLYRSLGMLGAVFLAILIL